MENQMFCYLFKLPDEFTRVGVCGKQPDVAAIKFFGLSFY